MTIICKLQAKKGTCGVVAKRMAVIHREVRGAGSTPYLIRDPTTKNIAAAYVAVGEYTKS